MRQILTNILYPGKTIGIIGGGQLGQMMALSAKEMGFKVGVLDPTKDAPASQVADWSIVADYDDQKGINELAEKSDIVMYEFENVDVISLETIQDKVSIPQGLNILRISQNRQLEKEYLDKLMLPIAPYFLVESAADLERGIKKFGYPCVLKTCSGGYDGKGQVVLKTAEDKNEALKLIQNQTCVLEDWLIFDKEISVIVSGTANSKYEVFPLSENIHRNNILYQSIVPARVSLDCENKAKELALKLARNLKIKGTITIEMFVSKEENIIINEIAPRPHNSGHYSIEACNVSQFDTHIRGICDWPLPSIYLHKKSVMMNLLGQEVTNAELSICNYPNWYFHFYGKKEIKKDRKMGHITILSNSLKGTLKEIEESKIWSSERIKKC